MEFDPTPIQFQSALWNVLSVEPIKMTYDRDVAAYPAGSPFATLKLTFANSEGEIQTLILEPRETSELFGKVLLALVALEFEPAKKVAEFLDTLYPRKGG
jgi:hypothetical protein